MRYLTIVFVLISGFGIGQEFRKMGNPQSCKSAILKHHQQVKSIEADFSELVFSSMYKEPQKGKGLLKYKDPGKIRWEHLSPQKQAILISGKSLLMYENGKKVNNPNAKVIAKKINQLMTQLFSGEFMSEKEFTIQYYEHSSAYKLELRPKSDRLKRYVSRIDVIFDKSNLTMKEMTMVESPTDRIVYRFDDIKINPSLSDSQFTQYK